jgi:hypothetical protein
MATRNKNKSTELEQRPKQEKENDDLNSRENVAAAHEQAEEDIQQDAEFNSHSPNDDLDEGETARLGEDKTDLV